MARPSTPALIAALLAALALTACGVQKDESNNRIQSDGAGELLAAARSGLAASAPDSRHTYAADARLLKESIAAIPGVTDSSVLLNGLTAYVTLHLGKDTDIEESMRIREEAREKLSRLLPQYEVRVSVEKNRVF